MKNLHILTKPELNLNTGVYIYILTKHGLNEKLYEEKISTSIFI